MDEDEPAIVSGDVETIIIKPELTQLLFAAEDSFWSNEDFSKESNPDLNINSNDEYYFVTSSGEVVTVRNEDLVQTPFCLESYFMDNDLSPCIQVPPAPTIEIDRVTCYECDIVFINEHKLLEHLMTHIDVYRMGCDICNKDLNLEEIYQLHLMAVTWQSIYYCDFCRKSCAGVVRSKSQQPPPGKTYMCHDCEHRINQETLNFQNSIQLYENVNLNPPSIPSAAPQLAIPSSQTTPTNQPPVSLALTPPVLPNPNPPPPPPPPTPPPPPPPPPPSEVLQEHKQMPKSEECENRQTENSSQEDQDCCAVIKSPAIKKENKKYRRPKPKVQVVSESMKQVLRLSPRTRNQKKLMRSYKCRYCPLSFSENCILADHLREKHKFHKLKYVCKLCGKEFTQLRCYENHVSFHQLSKNHTCFVCNLSFLSKYELEQHARVHDKSEFINTYCDSTENGALDLRKRKGRSST